jgi:hypothetical protein
VSIVWDPETDVSNALDEVAEVSPRRRPSGRVRLAPAVDPEKRIVVRRRTLDGEVCQCARLRASSGPRRPTSAPMTHGPRNSARRPVPRGIRRAQKRIARIYACLLRRSRSDPTSSRTSSSIRSVWSSRSRREEHDGEGGDLRRAFQPLPPGIPATLYFTVIDPQRHASNTVTVHTLTETQVGAAPSSAIPLRLVDVRSHRG